MHTQETVEKMERLFGDEIRQDVRVHGVERALKNWGIWMRDIIYKEKRAIDTEEEEAEKAYDRRLHYNAEVEGIETSCCVEMPEEEDSWDEEEADKAYDRWLHYNAEVEEGE